MYESFYNLTEPPFRLTPDPRFYFSSATHKRALTHLRFGFHQREGFVVITGKPGTGKTELMLHLLEGLPHDRITYGKIVTSNLDANEILQQVAAAFHVAAHGVKKGVLLKKLEDVFLQHVRENKRLVLIVDEAHKLSINSLNELQMLTNFQLSGKAALQCFLSGHDNLKINLHNPELLHLKQRVITSTFLMPLEKHETQEYIEHRLRCVGWEGDPKFNLSAYTLIHDTTEGIPRQINALCNRILLRAYAEQKHYIDESMVSRAIDDVAAEPLASNLPFYQQAMPETAGIESIQQSSGGHSHQPVTNHFVSNEDTVAQEVVGEQATFPYNDQDETLPLPSALNGVNYPATDDSVTREASWSVIHDSTVLRESQTEGPSHGSSFDVARTKGRLDDGDDEIFDEARKMSDALSDFHNETATKPANPNTPPQNTGLKFPIVPESQAANDNIEKHSTELSRYTKTTRSWAAPLTYGSAALLLIAGGIFLWIYKFSNEFQAPLQAKNSTDDTFVATVKGMLPQDRNVNPSLDNDSKQNENLELAGTVPEQSIPPQQGSMAHHDELNLSDSINATEEQWDSGALGGDFLKEQAEQQIESAAEQVAANDVPVSDPNASKISTKPDEQQKQSVTAVQSEDTATAKENSAVEKELVVASVVTTPKAKPKANKSPALTAPQTAPTKDTKSQSKSADITTSKKTASVTAPAKIPSVVEVTGSSPKPQNKSKPKNPTVAKESVPKNPIAPADTTGAAPLTSASGNVAAVNSAQVSAIDKATAQTSETAEAIDKAQLNELLAKLTAAYEKGNLNQLLGVLSKDVRSNDGATRRDLKNGYRKLFNITDMRKMTISSVNWSKEKQVIHGKGEFELHVREKGADKITSYGGVISLEVDERAEGAVITRLTYDYKN